MPVRSGSREADRKGRVRAAEILRGRPGVRRGSPRKHSETWVVYLLHTRADKRVAPAPVGRNATVSRPRGTVEDTAKQLIV